MLPDRLSWQRSNNLLFFINFTEFSRLSSLRSGLFVYCFLLFCLRWSLFHVCIYYLFWFRPSIVFARHGWLRSMNMLNRMWCSCCLETRQVYLWKCSFFHTFDIKLIFFYKCVFFGNFWLLLLETGKILVYHLLLVTKKLKKVIDKVALFLRHRCLLLSLVSEKKASLIYRNSQFLKMAKILDLMY